MKLTALLLAAMAAPAGANPEAIGDALALCIEVVKDESPAPLEAAGLELLEPNKLRAPQWSVTHAAPAGIGEIRAGMEEWGGEEPPEAYSCYLHLPATNGSEAMRWEKLGLGPVMALTSDGFEQYGGSPVSPRLAKCPGWFGKGIYVSFYHFENVQGVRLDVSDRASGGETPCEE